MGVGARTLTDWWFIFGGGWEIWGVVRRVGSVVGTWESWECGWESWGVVGRVGSVFGKIPNSSGMPPRVRLTYLRVQYTTTRNTAVQRVCVVVVVVVGEEAERASELAETVRVKGRTTQNATLYYPPARTEKQNHLLIAIRARSPSKQYPTQTIRGERKKGICFV